MGEEQGDCLEDGRNIYSFCCEAHFPFLPLNHLIGIQVKFKWSEVTDFSDPR